MPITILAPELSISPNASLGGAVTDREFLYRLAERGYNIEILLPSGEQYIKHKNVNVTILLKNRLLSRSYTANFFFLKEIAKILRNKRIDILRVHSPYSVGIGISILRIIRECPPIWISYLHLEERLDWRILDNILPFFCDGITALSEDTLSELISRCPLIKKKVSKVTPLGIDTDFFSYIDNPHIDERFGILKDRPIVLFVGSLIKRKGIDILIRSWDIINSECPDAQLVIIGQGPLAYKAVSFSQKFPNVIYIRFATQKELVHFYSAADVFVFPTFKEGFGMVVGEAMSCQMPVVTTDAPGVRQLVIDGETGYKVPTDDWKSLGERTSYLLKHRDLAIAMGKAGRHRIQNFFSWEISIDSTEAFINMLLKEA